ncbi:MAG TPA: LytR C-terminal domain-containing protein [Parafilimonas sp.]
MNKDLWDKIGVIASFIQIVVIGAFTAVVSFYSAKMTNKLNFYKGGMDENQMISKLVTDLTNNDSGSHVKTDFALLSLERYLKSSQDGNLKSYDEDMLSGFAQSIILDRILKQSKSEDSDMKQNEILIESDFLKKNDTTGYARILNIISSKEKQSHYPAIAKNIDTSAPVNQVSDVAKTQTISLIFSKTCYIQYSNPGSKNLAESFQDKLNAKGWNVPKIQRVQGSYSTLIKYFHSEDVDNATTLKETLGLPANTRIIQVNGFESKVPLGQLEVWIGNQ